ncbi:MAG TPA: NAD(P)/FAD-dependent oxidoreductase [Thermoanaerobaculia bacterium]|nr:NAD(P)/FAD-dependent oxidoreductase [Thermoanaerobaculia bacterium]
MDANDSYDVAVIGAGLAGLECGRRLCSAGLRVLMIDRKPDISRSVHTTGIFVRRTLEDFDLPESCLGPPIRQVVLHSPARRPLFLSSPHDEFRVGRMGALYDRRLVECLNLGVHWSPATRLKAIEGGEKASRVSISIRGRARTVSARYVVGADGVASATARALGLDTNRRWIVGAEDVFRGVPRGGPPRFHCFLDPDLAPGYLAWIVDDGQETHLGVGGIPGRFDIARSLELFRREARAHVDLRSARLVERRGGPIPVGGILANIANGRGLLVGDAAGAPSPLTAGGLDPCLRLSALAASVIVRHLGGKGSALQAYSGRALRRRFRLRLALRAVMNLTTSRTLVELGCFLLRRTPLRSVATEIFFGRGTVSRGGSPSCEAGRCRRTSGRRCLCGSTCWGS